MKHEISKAIRPVRIKRYSEKFVNTIFVFFALASLFSLGISIYAYFIPLPYRYRLIAYVFIGLIFLGLVVGLLMYPRLKELIRISDGLGAKERLQTVFQLLDDQSPEAELQRQETLNYLKRASFASKYKMTFKFKFLIAGLLAIILSAAINSLGSQARDQAADLEQLQERLIEEKEAFEKEKDDLLSEYKISEEDTKALNEALKPLIEKLDQAKSEEEALKQLSVAKNELKKLELDSEQSKLQDLMALASGEKTTRESIEAMMEMAKTLESDQSREKVEKALENLKNSMDQYEKKSEQGQDLQESLHNMELSMDDLSSLLEALAKSDPASQLGQALAKEINKMAAGISSTPSITDMAFSSSNTGSESPASTSSANTSSLSQSAESRTSSNSESSTQASAQETNQASGQAKQDDSKASESGSQELNQTGEQGDGQGSTQTGGQGDGQGTTQTGGQGDGQGSTQTGESGSGQGSGRGQGSTKEYLYDPSRLGGYSEPSFVSGTKGDGGTSDRQDAKGQALETGEWINYQELYRDYFQRASETVDYLDVPLVMKDIILEYFTDIKE